MAYFRRNETVSSEYAEDHPFSANGEDDREAVYQELFNGDDDGLDELGEEEEPEEYDEPDEAKLAEYQKHRIRMLFNAGNLAGILAGAVLILLLIALLLSMLNFVMKDINHSFSLFQTKF